MPSLSDKRSVLGFYIELLSIHDFINPILPSIHSSPCLAISFPSIHACLRVSQSICWSIHPAIHPPICLSTNLSNHTMHNIFLSICSSSGLSIFLFACPSVLTSVHPSVQPFVCPTLHAYHAQHLSVHPVCSSSGPSIYLSVCHLPFLPFISLPVHLSVQLPICPSIHPSIHLFVHLSIYQFLSISFPFFHVCLDISPSVCWAIPPAIYSICLSSNLPKPIHSIFLSIHPVRSSFGLSLYLFVCIYPSFHSSL